MGDILRTAMPVKKMTAISTTADLFTWLQCSPALVTIVITHTIVPHARLWMRLLAFALLVGMELSAASTQTNVQAYHVKTVDCVSNLGLVTALE